MILAQQNYKLEQRWNGIMGVGKQKKTIIKQVSNRSYCAVRLGGMGLTLSTLISQKAIDLLTV